MTTMRRVLTLVCTLALAGLSAPAAVPAQQQRTFVETLGSDTTSVETWTLTENRLTGRFLIRPPTTRVVEYEAELDPDGGFTTFEARWTTPETNPDGPGEQSARYTFGDETITVELEGRRSGTVEVSAPDGITVPFLQKLPAVYGLFDHLSRVATERGLDEMPFYTLAPGSSGTAPNAFSRNEDGTVQILDFGNPVLAEVDEEGRILEVDARPSTHKVLAHPSDDADLDGLARRYAAMDARGEGMGSASSRDTVTVSGGGSEFWIDYGRPTKRGREIWGDLVPYGEVWRTGADAATQFRTSEDILIGGEPLPAGTYTLWTIPSDTGMTLIVNGQTGQWGTQYDASEDVLRVDMNRVFLRQPVERLTMEIEPTDTGGILHLSWDNLRFSVPLEVG